MENGGLLNGRGKKLVADWKSPDVFIKENRGIGWKPGIKSYLMFIPVMAIIWSIIVFVFETKAANKLSVKNAKRITTNSQEYISHTVYTDELLSKAIESLYKPEEADRILRKAKEKADANKRRMEEAK